MHMNDTGRVADTGRATEEVPPAVEEALAAVVAVVVTRCASLFLPDTQAVSRFIALGGKL